MIAIVSSEGEEINLERPVRAEGSVETWLTSLLQSAQSSLHSIIRNAVSILNDPTFNMLMFLDKMPAQVGVFGYPFKASINKQRQRKSAEIERRGWLKLVFKKTTNIIFYLN